MEYWERDIENVNVVINNEQSMAFKTTLAFLAKLGVQ